MNFRDKLRMSLRIKNIGLALLAIGMSVGAILLVIYLSHDTSQLKFPIILLIACIILWRPLSKAQKKDKDALKEFDDKEKEERKAKAGDKNPTNKFDLGISTTKNMLLGNISDISEQSISSEDTNFDSEVSQENTNTADNKIKGLEN